MPPTLNSDLPLVYDVLIRFASECGDKPLMIKVLMISTDKSVFDADSALLSRLKEQAGLVSELHVVVFTPKGERFKKFHGGEHLTIYPTSSVGKWSYLPDAFRLAKSIIAHHGHREKWLVSTQDPFETGALGYLIAKVLHVPLHLQIHTDPWSEEWKHERAMNRVRFALMYFLLLQASGIRVVSRRVEESVLRMGIKRECVTRVPIYTDVAMWKNAVPTFDLHVSYKMFGRIILSIGRLQPEKNFHGLIRAFAEVQKRHNDALLLIVGSGPLRERLLLLASSLGLAESVIVLPWARDVVSYYKTCDLYVQPSLYEGWGLAVVEAMASGAPVLMTNVGIAGELVRDRETGLVIPVADERALVGAMVEMLASVTLRKSLPEAAFAEVAKLPTHAETLAAYKASWVNAHHYGHKKTKK